MNQSRDICDARHFIEPEVFEVALTTDYKDNLREEWEEDLGYFVVTHATFEVH